MGNAHSVGRSKSTTSATSSVAADENLVTIYSKYGDEKQQQPVAAAKSTKPAAAKSSKSKSQKQRKVEAEEDEGDAADSDNNNQPEEDDDATSAGRLRTPMRSKRKTSSRGSRSAKRPRS